MHSLQNKAEDSKNLAPPLDLNCSRKHSVRAHPHEPDLVIGGIRTTPGRDAFALCLHGSIYASTILVCCTLQSTLLIVSRVSVYHDAVWV